MNRKQFISLILALALMLSLAPSGIADTKPYTYVALGDSIASGYGLSSASKCYATRVAGLIGATRTYNFAQAGMSSEEMLALLQDPDVAAKVASADLITVSAGCADILGTFTDIIIKAAGTDDFRLIPLQPTMLLAVIAALQTAQAQTQLLQSAQQAAQTLPRLLSAIRQLNPSAKLVFTNAYNPYTGVVIPSRTRLDLGALTDPLVSLLNQTMAAELTGATVIDLYSAFRSSTINCVNVSMKAPVDFDPHPNTTGHALIAQLIYDSIGNSFPVIKVPARIGKLTKQLTVYKKEGKTKLGTLPKGSSVVVYSWNDKYARIGWGNGFAFASTKSITLHQLLDEPVKTVRMKSSATVRDKASSKGKKLGSAYSKNQLVAFGSSGKWTHVQIGSKLGFVETKYVTTVK